MARSKKFLTKEEIQEIDKRVPLIPVYFDPIFKGVFLSDLEILKDYIITVLKLDIRPEDCTIKLLNGELLKRNYKEYQKTVDVIVSLTDDLYDAPLAQSKAIFNPDKSTDTVLLANFM